MTGNGNNEWKEEEDGESSSLILYSILNLPRNATEEEIHRSYRTLSTTFHPDKIRRRPLSSSLTEDGTAIDTEEIQETFLKFKKAHEILIDPVLRLTYDHYGEHGVELVRRVQQQQREQKSRRDQKKNRENDDNSDSDDNDDDEDFDEEDDDDEEDVYNLYERIERWLVGRRNIARARAELDEFMAQHDYHQALTQDNCVHLNLSLTFPPVIPLKPVLYDGRDYLRGVGKTLMSKPPADAEEREYYKQVLMQEKSLVDYQINQLRSSQKADVGFTLSSVPPPRNHSTTANRQNNNANHNPRPLQPSKWSMAMGCSTDLIYPGVTELANMANEIKNKKKKQQQEDLAVTQKHPVSIFCNTSYAPNPQTQVFGSANLNNDNNSHQYSLGSTHTFSNQTAARYGMTFLTRSPLPDSSPVIFNLKSYRHLHNLGTTSVGISASSGGQFLQWNAKWEGTKVSKQQKLFHKVSAKASVGILQGNSVELGYKCKFPKNHAISDRTSNSSQTWYEWLDANTISLPHRMEVTTVLGQFYKISAMVTHELQSLATHPSLGFGLEHDITLGRWAWIWEFTYQQSTFRVPISILHLGSIHDPRRFYAHKLYYGIYCLLLQSMVAELLGDEDDEDDEDIREEDLDVGSGVFQLDPTKTPKKGTNDGTVKTKAEAEKQLALMKPVAEEKRYMELQRQQEQTDGGGLLILEASYWQKFSHTTNDDHNSNNSSSEHEIVSMDATVQLQFWVTNSKLSIPKGLSKALWMGFYSLHTESKLARHKNIDAAPKQRIWSKICTFVKSWTTKRTPAPPKDVWEDPQLTVRYSFRGSVYEITVSDTASLDLPCPNDAVETLGDADVVQ